MTATPERSRFEPIDGRGLAEAAYRALFLAAGDPILILDADARCLAANDGAASLLGYTADELSGMHLADLVMLDSAQTETAYARLLESGRLRTPVELRHKHGSPVLVESVAVRVDLPGGPVSMAILRDLEERRTGEAAERARAEQIRLITDALPVLIAYVDADQRYRFLNSAHRELFGRPLRQMLGRQIGEVVGAETYETIRPHIEQALRGERVSFDAEMSLERDRRRVIAAVYVPHQDLDGTILGFFSLMTDLTERKRAEDDRRFIAAAGALLAESLDYPATLQRVATLSVSYLADCCVVDMLDETGRLRRLAVATAEDITTDWIWEVGDAPLDLNAAFGPAHVLRSGRSELLAEVTDTHLVAAARNERHLELLRRSSIRSHMIVPLRARGRTLGILTFIGTRSRNYAEADLALAEELAHHAAFAVDNARLYHEAQSAVRIRDEFLSSVSHDLRTPLTSIKGWIQLLIRQVNRGTLPPADALVESLSTILSVTDRMNALVDELVDLGRLESGRRLELTPQLVDLVALVRQGVAEHQRGSDQHVIRVVVDREDVHGEWDAIRLERVFDNLLANAVRYSPEGGNVTVSVRREDASAVVIVEDDGVGIPAADLPRIFDRFHRGSNVSGRIAGAGVGLAGVKQIVEQHGGTVTVESEESRGTRVTVRLPIAAAP
ncbi:MAG: PAS domain-containing protein [Dehalococcoidia bacterium]